MVVQDPPTPKPEDVRTHLDFKATKSDLHEPYLACLSYTLLYLHTQLTLITFQISFSRIGECQTFEEWASMSHLKQATLEVRRDFCFSAISILKSVSEPITHVL